MNNTPTSSWMYSIPKSKLLRYGQWLVIPTLLFLGLEKVCKHWILAREQGYITAMAAPPSSHVDAVFIGVSHVFAAIDSKVFDEKASKALGRPFTSLNLAGGGRSLATHYLGLRDLFQMYPNKFKGCTIFLEAPFDMPDSSTWKDPWYLSTNEMYPIRLMHKGDLPGIIASEHSLSRKALIYGLWIENHSSFLSYRALLRRQMLDKAKKLTVKLARKANLLQEGPITHGLDVQAGGTMRTDPVAITIGYSAAGRWFVDAMKDQKPVLDWNATILADLHRLALQNGGRLVLFRIPKHSMFAPPYQTAVRREDAKTLAVMLAEWHTSILEPNFSYTDNDFPDYWHVRHSLRVPYTNAVADAWLKSLNIPPQDHNDL